MKFPEQYRVNLPPNHPYHSNAGDDFGLFEIPAIPPGRNQLRCRPLRVIASAGIEGYDWEHVSVSVAENHEIPTWNEMCRVKKLFWEPEQAVMQLHPPESNYVNAHPGVLHLWRPKLVELPQPPREMV